jgi:hypothetical protein
MTSQVGEVLPALFGRIGDDVAGALLRVMKAGGVSVLAQDVRGRSDRVKSVHRLANLLLPKADPRVLDQAFEPQDQATDPPESEARVRSFEPSTTQALAGKGLCR